MKLPKKSVRVARARAGALALRRKLGTPEAVSAYYRQKRGSQKGPSGWTARNLRAIAAAELS